MEPDWFILMQEWKKQNYGDRGITLPFLVGALAFKENNSQPTAADARSLLEEMITSPVDNYVTEIGWCSSLGAPVLAAARALSGSTSKVGFKRPSKDELCLIFGDDLQRHGNLWNSRSLVEELVDDTKEPIEGRRYSRDSQSQSYRVFEPWETKFIEETIMSHG